MRNLHIPSRSPAYSKKAMVATSHTEATYHALEIMKKGGNAFDAAVTAASVLAVVEAHSTGIGGDCFCLFYSNTDKKVIALNGSGNVPKTVDYTNIKKTKENLIDPYSANAITIPGAVAAWSKLINDYGNLQINDILAPAIKWSLYPPRSDVADVKIPVHSIATSTPNFAQGRSLGDRIADILISFPLTIRLLSVDSTVPS